MRLISQILKAYGMHVEFNMWYQEDNKAKAELKEQLTAFREEIVRLLSALLNVLDRLKPDHYFEATLDFYAKVLAFEKPDEYFLRADSKFFSHLISLIIFNSNF